MPSTDAERLDQIYHDARERPLRDGAYLLWVERYQLNRFEGIEEGLAFPPLPEGETMVLLPEIYRRARLSIAYENDPANLRKSETFRRLVCCRPEAGEAERLAALTEAFRIADEVHRTYRDLMATKTLREVDCIRDALLKARRGHPGLLEASYATINFQLGRAIR